MNKILTREELRESIQQAINESAYQIGFEQYQSKFSDNPYEQGSVAFRRWVDGMVDGMIAAREKGSA